MRILTATRNPDSGRIELIMAPGTHPSTPEITNYAEPETPTPGPWIDAYADMWEGEEQLMISSTYSASDHMAIAATHGKVGDFRVFRAAGAPDVIISELNTWMSEDF